MRGEVPCKQKSKKFFCCSNLEIKLFNKRDIRYAKFDKEDQEKISTGMIYFV